MDTAHLPRLVYLGTPEMAVPPLRALVDAGFEVALVVSRPDRRRGRGAALTPSPVKAAALELGLPVTDVVDDALGARADLGVVVAFGRIIKPHVLAELPMVNLHFSLLPRWRGAAPLERALLAGDPVTGVCVMDVEEGLDTGGTYACEEVPIGPEVTADELRAELVEVGTRLLVDTLVAGIGEPVPQVGETTYAEKIDPSELEIDWSRPATEIDRLVRLGGAWTTHDGRRLKVWRVGPAADGAVTVPTGDGPLALLEVQPEGKGRMAAADWARGVRLDGPPRVGVSATRRLAIDALVRIEVDQAYANLLLPELLSRADMTSRDRAFVTNLVYGTVRMRRACDWLVDRFVDRELDPNVRAALRVGAFQLAFLDTPPHAAVGETVEAVPKKVRGLVNAVLRRVAAAPRDYPDDATRLSYPDWIIERLAAELGPGEGIAALEAMNEPAEVTERDDGYVQDRGSQLVTEAVGASPGDRVVDLCAAPGGKATGLAGAGARVVALDSRPARAHLVYANASRLDLDIGVAVADGRVPPLRPASADRVLVDAPCSGLGALRRRPDARWRIEPAAVDRLAVLQRELLEGAAGLVTPGGTLVYSVCTLTRAESVDVAERFGADHEGFRPLDPPAGPWVPWGSGGLLLPQAEGTDGMAVFRWLRAD